MSAQAGWYPDPGGGAGLYRYWDGRAWSAATSPNPAAPAPAQPLGAPPPPPASGAPAGGYGQTSAGAYGQTSAAYGSTPGYPPQGYGSSPVGGSPYGPGQAYAGYRQPTRKSTLGWWLGAAALLLVIVVVAVFAIRAATGSASSPTVPNSQPSQNACPERKLPTTSPLPDPSDGRVHGGPLSYPELGEPWSAPQTDDRVPFGSDVAVQQVMVEPNYDKDSNWVASVLVGELQAGDGFYTPQQGSQIVVRCILGAFYGDNPVESRVKVNQATTIDGHEAWLVESQLSFDIPNLKTKGELLIVAIVAAGATAGIYYASIPDSTPRLVQPARDALKNLKVDG